MPVATAARALRAGVLLAALLPALGQRAPCYECEAYKDLHPRASPYQVWTRCSYPCSCPAQAPSCPGGAPLVRDACGCCDVCARQLAEPCSAAAPCDASRGLVCRPPARGACRAAQELPCLVGNRTYHNGETFLLDCRTQCSCQNGTYACASLCPQEYISPRGSCAHPRLVDVPGQCCREWMCDSASAQHPPDCREDVSSWSACSSACGAGLSRRVAGGNSPCPVANETRLCQVRACEPGEDPPSADGDRHHHVRKGHECKATQRAGKPARLQLGPCWSRKLYRPKMCGRCASSQLCCEPHVSATLRVDVLCEGAPPPDLAAALRPGAELWRAAKLAPPPAARVPAQVPLQWVIKCRCSGECSPSATGPTTKSPAPTNEDGELILHRVHRTTAP